MWLRFVLASLLAPWPSFAFQDAASDTSVPAAAVDSLAELAARDARVSFRPESGERARALLLDAPLDAGERSIAVVALGAARLAVELARVESMAADGKLPERRAALYAMGELGADGYPGLEHALARDTTGLDENLVVALWICAQNGGRAALERLNALAAADTSLALPARTALGLRDGGTSGTLQPALELYYEMRWRAAQTYGLIDGQRWQKNVQARLYANEEFLDRVILGAAADLSATNLKAHLIEILFADERPGALRMAALLLPEELARAAQSCDWKPASLDSWRAILAEIDERHAERHAQKLLQLAYQESSELEPLAGMLLLRSGADLPWRWVGEQLTKGAPELRSKLVEACGDRGEKARIPDLADLIEKRRDLGVFGEGLVALARLGHPPALEALDTYSKGAPSKERTQTLNALARVLHDKSVRRFAEQALRRDDLEPDVRLGLEIGLAEQGAAAARESLRKALADLSGREPRLRAVRALAQGAGPADVLALRGLFPAEDDLDLNVELGLVLVRARDAAAHAILSAALWSDSWNRSVLAGGLIARNTGIQGLMDELDTAPRAAKEADLRRVGFAIGEWGGVGAVEELARSHAEGDAGLQGALLGALSARAGEPEPEPGTRVPVKVDFPRLPAAPAAGGKPAGKPPGKHGGGRRHRGGRAPG